MNLLAVAEPRGINQHPASPAVDIVGGDLRPQRPHPLALFGVRHVQRGEQRVGDAVDVVGVDDERLGQFPRGTGKTAEQKHTPLVIPSRHKLFRHEIHAVMQAADVADIRGPVVAQHLWRLVVPVQEDHGWMRPSREPRVDAIHLRRHTLAKLAIPINERPAGGGNLENRQRAPVSGHRSIKRSNDCRRSSKPLV